MFSLETSPDKVSNLVFCKYYQDGKKDCFTKLDQRLVCIYKKYCLEILGLEKKCGLEDETYPQNCFNDDSSIEFTCYSQGYFKEKMLAMNWCKLMLETKDE